MSVLTCQIGIKKISRKEFEFHGGSKPTRRLTETRSRAKLFDAELCQNIKTAEGVAWPKLKSTHRMNLAKLVPLPDQIDPSQD